MVSWHGGVRYELASGPRGMTVDSGGELTWDAPENYPASEARVIVSARDGNGRYAYDTFKIEARDAP